MLDGNYTSDFKEKALASIFDVYRDSKDASLISLMESRLTAFQAKNFEDLEKTASRLLTMMYAASGRYAEARDMAQNLRMKDADDEKFALMQLAMLEGFSESERAASQSAIAEMRQKYTSSEDEAFLAALGVSSNDSKADLVAGEAEDQGLIGYPNPFNPSTRIEFTLKKADFVTLKVYDVLGREVATLLNEMRQPGVHSITWNAGNAASGVYFIRLSVAGKNVVKKMLMLK